MGTRISLHDRLRKTVKKMGKAPQPRKLKDTVSPAEAAKILGVQVMTVMRWIWNGRMKAAKSPTRWRIKRKDVVAPPVKPGAQWLTREEVAQQLGITRDQLSGRIRVHRIPTKFYMRRKLIHRRYLTKLAAPGYSRGTHWYYGSSKATKKTRVYPPPQPTWLSFRQVAERLGVVPQYIYQLANEGRIRAVQTSEGWRVRPRDCRMPPKRKTGPRGPWKRRIPT